MYACLIDGREAAAVDARDRGLHYGDGLFETLAVEDGIPLLWSRHLDRLAAGCARLGMPAPDAGLLWHEAASLCAGRRRAVLKLVLTRGRGGRGYAPDPDAAPTRMAALYPWPDHPAQWASEGVAVRVCRTRLAVPSAAAGLKHLNRLEQVMARAEWRDAAIAEGLMLDPAGNVIEGTMSNVFAVCGGRLVTPDLSAAGVAGVVRAVILEAAAAAGMDCEVRALPLDELLDAGELLLCNSVIRVWPVRSIDGRPVARGAAAARLAALVRDREKAESAPRGAC